MKSAFCAWNEDEDGNWKTQCDNYFCYLSKVCNFEERPGLMGFNFCPYCSKKIKTKKYVAKPWQ